MTTTALSLRWYFSSLHDPRVQGRTTHRLLDIISIAICAVIAGADDWHQIETFARRRHAWLATFLPLPGGIPAHDTFERVFARLQPAAFQSCFRTWIAALAKTLGLRHIALDGKTLRGSAPRSSKLGPLQLVSAWAWDNGLSLGQVAVDPDSNEIAALPKLLELLDLSGALVSIDAIGCQEDLAKMLVAKGADYILTVKGNQPHLYEDLQALFGEALASDFAGWTSDIYESEERGHGRTERRCYMLLYDVERVRHRERWAGLSALGMCYSQRTSGAKTSEEIRYFIGNAKHSAELYGKALRGHWQIENNLHWQLDVSFGEDGNRVGDRTAAENLALLRRLALVLLKRHPSKKSIAGKRYEAALDTDFLEEILDDRLNLEKL